MKNKQGGFVVPLLLIILVLVGGGAFFYTQNNSEDSANRMGADVRQGTTTTQGAPTTSKSETQTKTPVITSISPSSGSAGTLATLEGYFPAGTTVNFDGEAVSQIKEEMRSYSFFIPSTVRAHGFGAPPTVSVFPGMHVVSLSSESSTIGSVEFEVTPTIPTPPPAGAPTITSVSPSEITVGATREVTVYGSNFSSKSMIAVVGAGVVTSIGPTRIAPDGTSMVFAFPQTVTMPALYSVDVYNVGDVPDYTHGGPRIYNATAVVTLTNPYTPAIFSIAPASTPVGGTVTITGSNFYGDSKVIVGMYLPSVSNGPGPITPSSYTSTTLTFIIPSSMGPGKYVIAVAGSKGHASSEVLLTVVAP